MTTSPSDVAISGVPWPYDTYRGALQTGDVLLFCGKGPIAMAITLGQLIEGFRMAEARMVHIGLVIVDAVYDQVLVWESTLTTISRQRRREAHAGVQVSALRHRLAHYDGELYVRRLRRPLDVAQCAELARFRHEIQGRPYEGRWHELVGAVLDGYIDLLEEDLSSLFCSELVAEAHQRCGLLPEATKSNNYAPADFTRASLKHLEPEIHQLIRS